MPPKRGANKGKGKATVEQPKGRRSSARQTAKARGSKPTKAIQKTPPQAKRRRKPPPKAAQMSPSVGNARGPKRRTTVGYSGRSDKQEEKEYAAALEQSTLDELDAGPADNV